MDLLIGPLDQRINSQVLVDFQFWADVDLGGHALFDKSKITVGARNVLNAAPEFAHAGASWGYDISQSELTRRFMYLRVAKRF